jgi:hypothetical protein
VAPDPATANLTEQSPFALMAQAFDAMLLMGLPDDDPPAFPPDTRDDRDASEIPHTPERDPWWLDA